MPSNDYGGYEDVIVYFLHLGCPVFAFTDGKMWVGDKTGIKVCELTTGEVQTRMG